MWIWYINISTWLPTSSTHKTGSNCFLQVVCCGSGSVCPDALLESTISSSSALGVANLRWNRSLMVLENTRFWPLPPTDTLLVVLLVTGCPGLRLPWGAWGAPVPNAAQAADFNNSVQQHSSPAAARFLQERSSRGPSAPSAHRARAQVGASRPWSRGNGSKGFRAAGHACWKLPELSQARSPVASLALYAVAAGTLLFLRVPRSFPLLALRGLFQVQHHPSL